MTVYVLKTDYENITYSSIPEEDIEKFIEVDIDPREVMLMAKPKYNKDLNTIVDSFEVDIHKYKNYIFDKLNHATSCIRKELPQSQLDVYKLKVTEAKQFPNIADTSILAQEAKIRGIPVETLAELVIKADKRYMQTLIDTELARVAISEQIKSTNSIIELESLLDVINNLITKYK